MQFEISLSNKLTDLCDMVPELKKEIDKAKTKKTEYKQFLEKLGKKPPRNLDSVAQQAHDEVFLELDCLQCANCCKTTSPIFRMVDIERLAKYLKTKASDIIGKHLHIDTDGDYVLNSSPCVFLGPDNYCSVYSARPNACREYPHTNRKNFHQIANLTFANSQMCPATARIVEKLMLNKLV